MFQSMTRNLTRFCKFTSLSALLIISSLQADVPCQCRSADRLDCIDMICHNAVASYLIRDYDAFYSCLNKLGEICSDDEYCDSMFFMMDHIFSARDDGSPFTHREIDVLSTYWMLKDIDCECHGTELYRDNGQKNDETSSDH